MKRAVPILLAMTGLVVSCSSGSSSTNGAAGSDKSPAAFQTAADGFCATAYRDGNSIQSPTDATQTASALTQFAQILQTLVENLKTLTPPAQEQAVFESFTTGLETASTTYADGAKAVTTGGVGAINAVLNQTNGEATALAPEATALGLADCVTFLTPSTGSSTTTTIPGP